MAYDHDIVSVLRKLSFCDVGDWDISKNSARLKGKSRDYRDLLVRDEGSKRIVWLRGDSLYGISRCDLLRRLD